MRILVIEDSPSQVLLLEDILAKQGHEVVSFNAPSEALVYRSQNRPDLIILDLVLPGMSGMELLKRFRQVERGEVSGPVPVLITSALEDGTLEALAALKPQWGPFEILAKPFEYPELLARLEVMTRIGPPPEE